MATLLPPILLPAPISLVPPVGSVHATCWSSRPKREAPQMAGGPGGSGGRAAARSGVPLFLAAVLVAAALLVAPERPHDQEAICQRHRGEVACRVW
ncbi:MAG: hypothetical protein ACOVQK_06295 [Cyanobium sp.]|jgi:hypothetical protein